MAIDPRAVWVIIPGMRNTIILLFMLPVNGLFLDLEQSTVRLFAQTVFLVTFVWWLTIAGSILRRAAGVTLLARGRAHRPRARGR